MADRSFLAWPFLDDRHRQLAEELDQWAGRNLQHVDHGDIDAACRGLVQSLARDGWLIHSTAGAMDSATWIAFELVH